MKRMLVLAAVTVAAVLPIGSASAEFCVTNDGRDIVCVHDEGAIEEICVTVGGNPLVCV